MAVATKFPVSSQFRRGLKGGTLLSDAGKVKDLIPFGAFLDSGGTSEPPSEVNYGASAEVALAALLGQETQGTGTLAALLRTALILYAEGNDGAVPAPTTQEANSQYTLVFGAGDKGGAFLTGLSHFQKKGLKAGGSVKKIEGYATVKPGDRREAELAVSSTRGLVLTIMLDQTWYEAASQNFVWDVPVSLPVEPIAVAAIGYSDAGVTIAWGGLTGILTWAAYTTPGVVLEAFVVFGEGWQDRAIVDEMHVNKAALVTALGEVKAGKKPTIPTPPAPVEKPAETTAEKPAETTKKGMATLMIGGTPVQVPIYWSQVEVTGPTASVNYLGVAAEFAALCNDAALFQWGLVAMHFATALQLLGALPSPEAQEQFLSDLGENLTQAGETPDTESD